MLPDIPPSAWEQIPIVIVFSILLGGIGWLMVKAFSKAVADITNYYAAMVEKNNAQFSAALLANNQQWQLYFDARSEAGRLVDGQVIDKLENIGDVLISLSGQFDVHDKMESQAIDMMIAKRKRNPN